MNDSQISKIVMLEELHRTRRPKTRWVDRESTDSGVLFTTDPEKDSSSSGLSRMAELLDEDHTQWWLVAPIIIIYHSPGDKGYHKKTLSLGSSSYPTMKLTGF